MITSGLLEKRLERYTNVTVYDTGPIVDRIMLGWADNDRVNFGQYTFTTNNCAHFVIRILKRIGINVPENKFKPNNIHEFLDSDEENKKRILRKSI